MALVMYSGGPQINQQVANIIRYAGLGVPVILVFYGLLIQEHVISDSHYVNDSVFYGLMIPWVAVALFQFFYVTKNLFNSGLRLIIYHVLSAMYILFVSGFETLFVVAWVLLFLASYAYFSKIGFYLSTICVITVVIVDSILHMNQTSIMITDIISLTGTLIVGFAAIFISHAQIMNKAELSRSKTEETLQRDRVMTLVNNLSDAVLSTDSNGAIQIFNAASLSLLDTNQNLEGQHIDDVLRLHDQDNHTVQLHDKLKRVRNTTIRDDLTMTIEDDALRLEVTYSPIRSSYSLSKRAETQDGYIIILRDITKAKGLEEERDEFVSVISHELRTPITITEGTISNVQLMMERPDISKKILKNGIDTAHEQILFLAKMVNDLSTLSRAERGVADSAESINVRALANELFEEYTPQAEKKALHFNLDVGPHLGNVTVSRLYLQELLQNFLTNAIKYTKEGSVTLHIERQADKVLFEVKDTGIGISKTDQPKIFRKFYRSEDFRTRETGGTGLGLYVAVKLAKKLGAQIELNSRLNHGSSFSFDLPIDK